MTPALERAYPRLRTAIFNELHGLLGGGLITQDMEGGAQDDPCGGDVFFVSKLCGDLLDEGLTAAGVFFKIHVHGYRNFGSHGHRMLRGFCGRLPCSCERFMRGNPGCSPAWDAQSFQATSPLVSSVQNEERSSKERNNYH